MAVTSGRRTSSLPPNSSPEVRTGDASAFSVPGPDGKEKTVMMVQCRVSDDSQRADLRERLQRLIHQELGIECYIDLVPSQYLAPHHFREIIPFEGAERIFETD